MQALLSALIVIQQTFASTTCDCSTSCSSTISDDFIYCSSKQSCINYNLTVTLTLSCTGDNGCKNSDITTAGSYAYVKCLGYFGCKGADIDLNAYAGGLYCYGDNACFDSMITNYKKTKISCRGNSACKLATISTDYWVYCEGASGCYKSIINQLNNNNGVASIYPIIVCEGNRACVDIDINSAAQIWCRGYESCAYTIIKNVDDVSGSGYYALQDAEIQTTGLSELDVDLKGFGAGRGLNIYCNSGVDCTIYCDGWGCKDTVIHYYRDQDITINGHPAVEDKLGELNIVCKLSMFQGTYYGASVWCPTLIYVTAENEQEIRQKRAKKEEERVKRIQLIDSEIDIHQNDINENHVIEDKVMGLYQDNGDLKWINHIVDNNKNALLFNIACFIGGGVLTSILICCYFNKKYKNLDYQPL